MSTLVEVPNSSEITSVSAIAIITATIATPRCRLRRRRRGDGAGARPSVRSRSKKALMAARMVIVVARSSRDREVEGFLHPDPSLGHELVFLVVGPLGRDRDADTARQPPPLAVGLHRVP